MSEHKLHKPFFDPKITPSNKKYSVYVLKSGVRHLIHFGDRHMQQYYDKLGHWVSKDHLDPERRKNYLARAKGIVDKSGKHTWKDINHANYYAVHYLW
jgi:hypothetical protein